MSGFIQGMATFGMLPGMLSPNDVRHCDEFYFGNALHSVDILWPTVINGADVGPEFSFASPWWPTSNNRMGDGDGIERNSLQYAPRGWGDIWSRSGCNGRLGYTGYTRDQYGSALGGCTVRLYRTSTEEQVAKVTSDANGLYFATTPYSDAHFLVIHNAAGDQAGATATTLLPG